MTDTIEWLETIGKDSTLRYASMDNLSHILKRDDASDILISAVTHRDSTLLSSELGQKIMHCESTHTFWDERDTE